MSWAIGIDVGGTNIKAVAVSADGAVRHRASCATEDRVVDVAEWARRAMGLIAGFEKAGGSTAPAVGVCAPGLAAIDGRSIAHLPGKLAGIAGVDWTRALGRSAAVPVLNDAHAALLGEAWTGAARDRRHVVMLTLGTGIGGAVLCDGRLLRGAVGRAGHIGHLSLDPDGPVSIVGMPGAIEMLFGDCSVLARSSGRFVDTTALVAAHRAGDPEATRIWLRSIHALGSALASCINLFDPELIVLGGGIAQAGEVLFSPLRAELDRIEWRPGGHQVPVVAATLGEWAGAIGAARQAIDFDRGVQS
jgi:glucokinase